MTLYGGMYYAIKDTSDVVKWIIFAMIIAVNAYFWSAWLIYFLLASQKRFKNSFNWLRHLPCFNGVFEEMEIKRIKAQKKVLK